MFWRFWGHFFLINHIGFSLKYVAPKSSTDFFHRKKKFSTKFFIFFHFLSYLMPNPCKWHRATPPERGERADTKKSVLFPLKSCLGTLNFVDSLCSRFMKTTQTLEGSRGKDSINYPSHFISCTWRKRYGRWTFAPPPIGLHHGWLRRPLKRVPLPRGLHSVEGHVTGNAPPDKPIVFKEAALKIRKGYCASDRSACCWYIKKIRTSVRLSGANGGGNMWILATIPLLFCYILEQGEGRDGGGGSSYIVQVHLDHPLNHPSWLATNLVLPLISVLYFCV